MSGGAGLLVRVYSSLMPHLPPLIFLLPRSGGTGGGVEAG